MFDNAVGTVYHAGSGAIGSNDTAAAVIPHGRCSHNCCM